MTDEADFENKRKESNAGLRGYLDEVSNKIAELFGLLSGVSKDLENTKLSADEQIELLKTRDRHRMWLIGVAITLLVVLLIGGGFLYSLVDKVRNLQNTGHSNQVYSLSCTTPDPVPLPKLEPHHKCFYDNQTRAQARTNQLSDQIEAVRRQAFQLPPETPAQQAARHQRQTDQTQAASSPTPTTKRPVTATTQQPPTTTTIRHTCLTLTGTICLN